MSFRHRTVAVALVLCSSSVVVLGRAQQAPTFSSANRTVAVYATVTDAAGRLLPDLERTAFAVDDNGKRQELTLFANEIQPITAVVLLDRSGSMRANFDLVAEAAAQFVNALMPGDQARMGSFANRIQLDPSDFTSDREELRRILRSELQPEGPTPLWNAVNVGITALLHRQGRRVILVFTDGVDAPMNFRNNNQSLKDVMKRAEEENVMVYAIGLAGENPAAGGGHHSGWGAPGGGGRMPGGRGGMGGWGRPPGGGMPGGRPFAVDNKPDEGLPKIAAATGGGYFELTSANDLAATFERVADELHHQYALGFTPQLLDGKMHALAVHVASSGAAVRARKSYLAAKAQ
jgi:VWFA-related protein